MRRVATTAIVAISGLAAHVLLQRGAFGALPVAIRLAVAFVVLVMLPGWAFLVALRVSPPGGRWLSAGWALGLGVGWLGAQVMCTRVLHVPFTVLASWAAVPNALLWLLPAWLCTREASGRPSTPGLGPVATAAVLAAAILACVHVARVPTPVSFQSDSPDHIGSIRRMMAEGDAFPVDAFFRDAGRAGADPRKGLWHPGIATIATLAHADPLDAWRLLAAVLAPLFVLNAAAFAFMIGGPTAAAIGAWALLLTYGGSLASPYLREAVFATKFADQLALATITAVLVDLDARRHSTRLTAVGLALGAVAVHVFAAIQFAVVFGALGAGLLVTERGVGPRARRLLGTAGALGLACLPYLFWRAQGSYAPNNVIHTEPQGLLTLAPGITVVSIGVLWDWLGLLWVVFPLSLWAWARNTSRPAVLTLLTTTLAVAVLLFCPPVVAVLQPRIGYLLMRFVWLLTLPAALAFAIPELLQAIRSGATRVRIPAAVALAGLGALLAPVVGDAAHVLSDPAAARARDAGDSVLRWRDALAWMDAQLPEGTVVLSDPATSYSIPMMTRHWVTTLVDQHSSPNDSLALSRILDARDALDPNASWARTRQVVRRWGATAIVLNDRFAEPPRLDYWGPAHGWFVRARARLDAAPAAFRRVHDTGDFVVYRIESAALDTLRGDPAPRSYVRVLDPGRDPVPRVVAPGMPRLLSLRMAESEGRRGDSIPTVIEWCAPVPIPAGAYSVSLRFDRSLPAGFSPPAWCAKPARKLLERLHHERYRFRDDHLPVGGDFGVDLWRPGEVVRDSFVVAVPADVAPGEYQVQVLMVRGPHYANYRLSDYFLDHDYYSGIPAGTLLVTGRP